MDTGFHVSFPCILQRVQQLDHRLGEARETHVLSTAPSVLTGSPSPGSLAALCHPMSANAFPLFPSPSCHKNILQPQTGREKWAAATRLRGAPDGVKHSLPVPFPWVHSTSRD